ncbi:hypothetical protein ACI2KR_09245 [Pseudomonas luteola]
MGARLYPKTPRVYLDQDGPLFDFEAGAKSRGMSFEHYKQMAGAFISLEVTKGAIEAVQSIWDMGYEPWVMTKAPDSNPYAATEKLLSINTHFPSLRGRVDITSDKGKGRSCDFLVDDHPEWANASNFNGTVILFKDNWPEILEILYRHKP